MYSFFFHIKAANTVLKSFIKSIFDLHDYFVLNHFSDA